MSGNRILVTGAEGFIGSHLVERLVRDGARVRAFVLYNFQGRAGWLDDISRDRVEIHFGDVRDAASVAKAMEGCDRVVHLAGQISVPHSYESPDAFIQANVTGLLHLLQAAVAARVRHFVHTSTSEVYGTARTVPMDESHPLSPQSPYAASKAAADHLAWSFYCSYGLPLTIARPFNTYGPRQSPRAIVATILSQLQAGGLLTLGTLEATRDFLYVDDLVEGYVRLLEEPAHSVGQVFHFGTGRETSIHALVDVCRWVADRPAAIERTSARERPPLSEVARLVCSAEKAGRVLNWSPGTSLEAGVQATWEWMRDPRHAALYDPQRYYR